MKKFLLLFCFVAIGTFGYSQIKVVATGNSIIGPNTGVTPLEQLHVVGKISMNSGQANNGVFGETNTRRMTFSTAPNTNTAWGFVEVFGDESHGMGAAPGRKGEFNFAGSELIFRAGKIPGNFGAVALKIEANKDAYFWTSNVFKQGNANWSTFSDKRLKKDIRDFDKGLDAVMQINPVYFTYTGKAGMDSSREFVGVVAQEFQKVAPYDVQMAELSSNEYDRTGESSEEYLSINDASVKYMLVNAIKEQQAMIELQAEKIAQLEQAISTTGATNNTNITLSAYDLAELDQNTPNPFSASTTISYVIPTEAKNAQINVYGQNGQLMRTLDIDHVGQGTLTVDADNLPSGTYSYQLIVDGRNIQTNKMVLTK